VNFKNSKYAIDSIFKDLIPKIHKKKLDTLDVFIKVSLD